MGGVPLLQSNPPHITEDLITAPCRSWFRKSRSSPDDDDDDDGLQLPEGSGPVGVSGAPLQIRGGAQIPDRRPGSLLNCFQCLLANL